MKQITKPFILMNGFVICWYPRAESNRQLCFRRALLYPFNYGDILNCVKALELNENNMCSTKAYTIKSTVNTSKASIKVLAEIEIFDFAKETRFLYPFNYGDILNCVKALKLNENNMCSTKAYTIKSTVNTSKASIKVLAEIEIFDFAKEARFLYPFNYGDIFGFTHV